MIICPRCGKDNQNHYKFCLGCGAELTPSEAAAGTPVVSAAAPEIRLDGPAGPATPPPERRGVPATGRQTPIEAPPAVAPAGRPAAGTAPAGPLAAPPPAQPPPSNEAARPASSPAPTAPPVSPPGRVDPALAATMQPSPAEGDTHCPTCGTKNRPGFTFCGSCGARLTAAPQERPIGTPSLAPGASPEPGAAKPGTAKPGTAKPGTAKPGFARLALIRPDGSEGGSFMLTDPVTVIGRGLGQLFDNDSYLSPQHARITVQTNSRLEGAAGPGQLVVEDLGSLNGLFVRLTSDEELFDHDVFRIGQELLRFDAIGDPQPTEDGTEVLGSPNPGYWGRLSLIVRRGIDGSSFPLMGEEMILGRERGDILFSDDGYVSGIHAKLSLASGSVYLSDLGSSNGSFIRIRDPRVVPFGTFVLMGQQLFRIETP